MSAPPSSTFTLFPYLPPELRLQVYRHLCHARVTTLTYHPPTDTFHTPTAPPTLLQICRESRAEGLRLYVKCLLPPPPPSSTTTTTTTSPHHPKSPNPHPTERPGQQGKGSAEEPTKYFYHHPHHDTLYLPRPTPTSGDVHNTGYAAWAREFAARLPHVAGAVRRLAVDYVPGEVRRPWEVFGKVCLMRGCAGLEEAFLVIGAARSGLSSGDAAEGDVSGDAACEGAEGREVEFVDPRAGDREIMGIMERVRASFRFELGDGFGLGLGGKEGWGEVGAEEGGLELVPKVVSEWGCPRAVCA